VNVVPIILVLGLAAAEPRPPPAEQTAGAPEAGEAGYWQGAPPGTPEDVALWNALRDAQSSALLHMGRLGQANFRIRYGRYVELLEEAVRTAPLAKAEEARQLRTRLEAAVKLADEGTPKKGVRIHPCRYSLFYLDQRMRLPDDQAMAATLPKVRSEARSCVDDLAPLAARLGPLADALEKAMAEADAFLDRDEPVPPPSAQPAAEKAPGPQPSTSGAPAPGPRDGSRP
jgi:hypothetical protein